MTYHTHPAPEHPDVHTTRVVSNDRFVSAGIALGDLIFVRRYSAWHNSQPLFELRFRRGTIDMSADTLAAIVRQGQEALAAPDVDPDISGSFTDMEKRA